jgi:hypothetical protein
MEAAAFSKTFAPLRHISEDDISNDTSII